MICLYRKITGIIKIPSGKKKLSQVKIIYSLIRIIVGKLSIQ